MARKVKVDMTGVESYSRCPEGTWRARLKKIDAVTIQGSGDDGLKAAFEIIDNDPDANGCMVFETFSLADKALWKLKSFLSAAGFKADGKLTIDLDKLEGKICDIDVIHDEYNGTKRAKISQYSKPTSESEDDEDEDDEEDEEEEVKKPAKKSAPAKKAAKKAEPEEDEDEDEEEEETPRKPSKKKTENKTAKKSKKKPEPEEDEDDEDDWEDDDE